MNTGPSASLLARFVAVVLAILSGPALAAASSPLVSPQWLRGELGQPDLVVLDMRSGSGAETAFAAAHIPGAVRSEYPGGWRAERNGVPWSLPEAIDLEAFLSSMGVGNDKTVVLVPAGTGSTEFGAASWPYWVLKYLGHDAVAILDGGWKAWQADPTNPVASGPSQVEPAAFGATLRPENLATTPEVAAALGTSTVLLDARPRAQWLGESKSSFALKAGRIPGALNLSYASLFAEPGRLKSREALAALVAGVVSDDHEENIIVYCNTGHWSSIMWFVLHELLGYSHAKLYEASMAGWTRDDSLPVETGVPSNGQ